MTKAELLNIRTYCKNIKLKCDDFLNLDPICYDPGNNYDEIVYISGQIDHILYILNKNSHNECVHVEKDEICWECGNIPATYENYYGVFFCENCVTEDKND